MLKYEKSKSVSVHILLKFSIDRCACTFTGMKSMVLLMSKENALKAPYSEEVDVKVFRTWMIFIYGKS